MTSLPILFFALFDFEYEKGEEHSGAPGMAEAADMEQAQGTTAAEQKAQRMLE